MTHKKSYGLRIIDGAKDFLFFIEWMRNSIEKVQTDGKMS